MKQETFWISDDGIITTAKSRQGSSVLDLTITFKLRDAREIDFVSPRLAKIQFTERSSLARIGIEIYATQAPRRNKDRLILSAEAFVYDTEFPCSAYAHNLVQTGVPAGRLFYAPESQKLSSDEIWQALQDNRIKLPNSTSIDRFGRVFLTPHKVRYTLPKTVTELDHLRLVKGYLPRTFLDKVQVREDLSVVSLEPQSGVLTSCSMYLKEHYVVLNRGEGNFGLHSGAVLLDPVKTFGSNVVLEIYNRSDQPVINPVVSIEVYRAPQYDPNRTAELRDQRLVFFSNLDKVYRQLDNKPKEHFDRLRPTTEISLRGQSARTENQSILIRADNAIKDEISRVARNGNFGFRTVTQALRKGDADADTLVLDYFPSLTEHIEILANIRKLKLKNLVFRKATPLQEFFLSNEAHSHLETYDQLGLKVYWHSARLNDLYLHTYKNDHGFFIREEEVDKFRACTILAFYGSALEMSDAQKRHISELVVRMIDFFGTNVGILTGGGEGVMGLATDVALQKGCLTGAAFLELEAQPPKFGVNFFNTFQETNRHNRQKWFQVADFCIFNVGGAGTVEEIGIELCNMKLGIRPRVPFVFFHDDYWANLEKQFDKLVADGRMPTWMKEQLLFSGDPDEIIAFYRKSLQIL
ncbi:LOG family protein [Pelagicoccus sp. SDUM812003]|uniref:LOG family protein n=1 Tax=Pelagicoccus sp. SDUM812003 TaxID=3041267 RepID=UPI00280FA8C9|nr:LOG family protein [Pelagicoccus sp. SDUM812003]MDQ8203154.1 LOG family protein [Pelagicoccus sp. SDUM812003]